MSTIEQLHTELLKAMKDGLLPSTAIDGVWASAGWVNVEQYRATDRASQSFITNLPTNQS